MRASKFCILFLLTAILIVCYMGCEDKIETDLTGKLKGRVVDMINYEPISEARITTNPYSKSVVTDDLGYFSIDSLIVGEYNIIAGKNGFKSQSITINVEFNRTSDLEFAMERSLSADNAPAFTDVYFPANDQTVNSLSVDFYWQVEPGSDTTYYELVLYEAGSMNNPRKFTNLTDTFLVVPDLKFESYYYWQLNAKNKSGSVFSDVRQFKTLKFPSNQILFSKSENGISQIFVADSLGENIVQVTYSQHHCWNAKVNNLHTAMAYESSTDLNPQLFVMNLDGTSVKKLTNLNFGGYFHQKIEYDWAPNGSHLIFTNYNKLYRINPDGTGMVTLASAPLGKHFKEVVYSRDGLTIYLIAAGPLMKERQIYSMNSNGSGMTLVYENPNFSFAGLAIHPDNIHLLFSMDMSGTESETGRVLDARIKQLNINSGVIEDLSFLKTEGTNDLQAMYAPDGGEVVCVNASNILTSTPSIWTISLDEHQRIQKISPASNPYWFE